MTYDEFYIIYNADDTKMGVCMGESISKACHTFLFQQRLRGETTDFKWTPYLENEYTKEKIKVNEGGASLDNVADLEITKIGEIVLNGNLYGIGFTNTQEQ